MSVAVQYIASGVYDSILVIGNEGLSKIVDWEHRSTCVLFGDGAGAAVLTESDKKGIIDFDLGAVGEMGMAITAPCNHFSPDDIAARDNERKHVIRMDGREVFKFATRKMAESVGTLLDKNKMGIGDVDLIIPHQANIRILQTAAKKLGIGMEKIYSVIDRYGNTSSASIPIAMCEAYSEGRIKKGDTIVMTGFGGGLTWASVLMEWV
jgi:3-oxoacyl-[acyl-carrier-protein] synthase-3